MTMPAIKIVDLQNNNQQIYLEELTQTAIGSLIFEAEQLLDELKDAEAEAND